MKTARSYLDQDIFGMARIGWVPSNANKSVEVYVHTDDSGKLPHFHVRKASKSGKPEWETCVLFESPEYFLHGKSRDMLPSRKLSKQLDQMLREPNPNRRTGETYWETAINAWNDNNSDVQVPPDLDQPDYSKL